MPRGIPKPVTEEFDRRGERVRVVVWLDRGQVEDLELLLRHRRRVRTKSAAVREAVAWLLAREAATLVRWRDADERRQRREAEERWAIEVAREERERCEAQAVLDEALWIAKRTDEHDGG
jgi:hypothetical protein